jgi:hypothetical protein
MLKLVTNNGMPNSQLPRVDTTSGTDVGSNSVRCPTQQNLMNMFESVNPPVNPPAETLSPPLKVTLLGRDGVPVARGYVMTTTANVCHGRDVLRGEKKIYIQEVLVPNAPIYDGPQFGCSDLSDFVEGGPLIWLESRLQYE